jgi:hypothetical protein
MTAASPCTTWTATSNNQVYRQVNVDGTVVRGLIKEKLVVDVASYKPYLARVNVVRPAR